MEKQVTNDTGIIDKVRNPFFVEDWRKQNRKLTPHRKLQLESLFGHDEKSIRSIGRNIGRYPAFVGIRWGFAKMKDGKLTATDKWHKREIFDGYGQKKNKY